jgi:NAD(P)-dependent dehydrogenase (short-subunit alcohol dehydrogenase family)
MNHPTVRPASLSPSPHTVVVTGGNSGLGYACAQALLAASPPWHVVLACRDPVRAQSAVETLRKTATTGAKVEAMVLDLASLASVRAFSAELNRRLDLGQLPPLHGLVCNAAMQGAKVFTVDGFEATFAVNHLGHFLLVDLLQPSIKAPARIAVVASGVHDPAQLEGLPAGSGVPPPAWNTPAKLAMGQLGPEAAEDDAGADRGRRYSTAKLANVYFTYGLAARLPEAVTVNAFDPGLMPGTGLAREYSAIGRFMWRFVMPKVLPLLRLLITKNIHTPAASGAALARLITDPSLADTNGRYFEGLREICSSVASYDKGRATELWEASAVLTSDAAVV